MRFGYLSIAFLAFSTFVATTAPVRASGNVATLIKRESQAFSDASAAGNATVLARLLDDNVTFVNENGEVATKADLLSGVTPAQKSTSQTLVQTDWHVRLYGSVAVTAFTDESTAHFHGQTLKAKFRSTEVWLDEKSGWKMISSQTLALPSDPPAIGLPPSVFDDYVGTYTAGAGYNVAITRTGDALSASVNGGKPFVLKAEVKDVFFAPGQPRLRRIFERNANGAIVGFVSRREGHDIALKRVS